MDYLSVVVGIVAGIGIGGALMWFILVNVFGDI
jgi:hypothetical protein